MSLQPTSRDPVPQEGRTVLSYDARQLFAVLRSCLACRLSAYFSHPERACPRCGR
jgi:hypothetical protein